MAGPVAPSGIMGSETVFTGTKNSVAYRVV